MNASERWPTSQYDTILLFTSIEQFINTGKIEFLRSAESKFDALSRQQYRIVAITGLFDKGKTWIINKLFGVNLPAGKLRTTQGLSFLWIEERRILVLDSQGVQAPVSYRGRAGAPEPILEAQTTESLVFELISRISHYMIFVLNDLTWPEQKYTQMLNEKYVINKQKKDLIVVFNMRNTSDIAEAQALFTRQVTKCYDGVSSHLSELVFTVNNGEDKPRMDFVGICQDGSEAGLKFNKENFGQILQKIEQRDTIGCTKETLQEKLQSEFNRWLPHFLDSENPSAGIEIHFVNGDGHEEGFDGYEKFGMFKLKGNSAVSMKTRGIIGPLGEIIAHDVNFVPVQNEYKISTSEGVKWCIELECPGVKPWNGVEIVEEPNGVTVTLTKEMFHVEPGTYEVQPTRRTHGSWKGTFILPKEEGLFEYKDDDRFHEDGVLKIFLHKVVKRVYGPRGNQASGPSIPKQSGSNSALASLPFASGRCCDAAASELGTDTSKDWLKLEHEAPSPAASSKNGVSPA